MAKGKKKNKQELLEDNRVATGYSRVTGTLGTSQPSNNIGLVGGTSSVASSNYATIVSSSGYSGTNVGGINGMAVGLNNTITVNNQIQQKPREIKITPLSYGFTVQVGCQTVAIESASKLIEKLKQYLDNPGEVERVWNQDSGQSVMNNSCKCGSSEKCKK